PAFFPILDIPATNPMTVQGVKLGRMLYYDPALHQDSAKACATCHIQSHSFTSDPNVIPHINLGWSKNFLWNGKVQGKLEDIMLFEVKDFFHANLSRLQNHPDYPRLFYEAFGTDTITNQLAANALAQFERTMISGNSKYDKVLDQNSGVFFTDEELNGYDLFFTEKADCFHCHGGILFTDNDFHNNALDANPEPGRFDITNSPYDLGKYKAPTLRNIELTGPYMHDGRFETLEQVINFYSEGLHMSETVDPLMKSVHLGGKHLSPKDKSDLLAFLKTLTDTTYISNPALSSPF
ncbi:MAG: c-type cytochrome, partial [Saprospiraceae bacterium]